MEMVEILSSWVSTELEMDAQTFSESLRASLNAFSGNGNR